jgi:quinol monooxygenase YgiN
LPFAANIAATHDPESAAVIGGDGPVRTPKKRISIFRWIARPRLDLYRRSVSELAVMISGRAQPAKRDEVRRLFAAHLAPHAIANPSQPIVVWCGGNGDPDAFYLWEVYTDPAAMEANGRAAWFAQYMEAVGPLLAGQPDVDLNRMFGDPTREVATRARNRIRLQ